jgi:hypothetical protein
MLVYDPNYPFWDFFYLINGVLMIVAASYAIKKVWEGSKNKFAYVLLAFTFLLGISYIGEAFYYAFNIKGTVYWDRYGYFKTVNVFN